VNFKGRKSYVDKKQYEAFQTGGTILVSGVSYKSKAYPDGVSIRSSQVTFTPKNVTLNSMSGSFMQTNFTATGALDNMIGYVLKDEPLAGSLNVTADKLDLNKWMPADTAKTTTAAAGTTEPFAVPKNIQFTMNAAVDQLHYDKTDYNKVGGTLLIKDETVTLKNIHMQALDGSIGMNGSYSTKENKKNPAITMSYDVQNLDVQKTFNAFNTVQKLMPVGKFISGKLNSKLSMKGNLGKDMMPNLSSLTGDGTLQILQGIVGKFEPLQKLASTLNLSDLKEIALKDIKNSFEFANGKVLVKPFNLKVKDIDMQIGGVHGIDQSIDYAINMKLPRALLGSQGNALVNNLASQASAKGIPVNLGETINLDLKMGGTITNPSLKTDLKGGAGNVADQMKQQALGFAQAKADSAKHAVKDTVAALKSQVVKEAKDQLAKQLLGGAKDTAKGAPQQNTDIKKRAEDAGKGLLNGFLKKKKDTTNH
ncbi:MAG TPA: AsmA-like C-terminal region-containing protein, partial [Chitinophagaceae bacterium]|nr:AsmA-like C-terminal region-containing protein [Chitinophagaceae bacterium]